LVNINFYRIYSNVFCSDLVAYTFFGLLLIDLLLESSLFIFGSGFL